MHQLCVSTPPKFRYEIDTSCTLNTKPLNTFYNHKESGIIGKCFTLCATCPGLGTFDDNKCDKFTEPYFMERDENGNKNGMSSQCHINCENCKKRVMMYRIIV